MAKNMSVIGIYPDRTTVSDAVDVLHRAGYRATDTSVLSSENQGSKDFAIEQRTKALEGARRERQRARWFALHWPGSFPFKLCRSTYWGRSSHLDRCWLLWLGPALAGRWVGSWGCWPACVCPNTSSSGTRAESGVAAFSYPFTATVRSGVTGRRKP